METEKDLLLPMTIYNDLPLERAYGIGKAVDVCLRAGMPYDKRSPGNS